jgi:serine/threonine protein kinase
VEERKEGGVVTVVNKWKVFFDHFSQESPNIVTETEFKAFCNMYYGRRIKVALKFMRHEMDYTNEVAMRRHMHVGDRSKYMLSELPSPEQTEFEAAVQTLVVNHDKSLAEYKHVVVLPAADRSLEDIFLKERPTHAHVRFLLQEVIKALEHLHVYGLMHGDLKKLNVLRVHHQIKLIDFDAAVHIHSCDNTYFGAKFSSGILPPGIVLYICVYRTSRRSVPTHMFSR